MRAARTAPLPDTHWLARRLAKDPGRGLTSHELRRSASTIIQTRTRDLNASRAQLRHSKHAMTINYTHPEDADGLDAVSAAYTAQALPLRRREASKGLWITSGSSGRAHGAGAPLEPIASIVQRARR